MNPIVYRSFGSDDGPPIVLLHGIGSSKDSWAGVAEYLPHVRSLAWDMPGYGDSPPLEAEWPNAQHYADALKSWLDDLDVKTCLLVGHSLGALIATRFARLYPGLARQLVLVSPALGHRVAPPDLSEAVAQRLTAFGSEGSQAFAEARAPRLLFTPAKDTLTKVTQEMARLTPTGHTPAARLLSGGDLLADAAHLAVPTHIVVGAQDLITPPKNARACFDAVPDAQQGAYLELENAGHALASETPRALAQAIQRHHREAFP